MAQEQRRCRCGFFVLAPPSLFTPLTVDSWSEVRLEMCMHILLVAVLSYLCKMIERRDAKKSNLS